MNKFNEIFNEMKLTFFFLAGLIFFWIFAGFFTSDIQLKIFNIPLWAIFGTMGVWIFAIAIAVTVSRKIKDIEF